MPYLGYYAMILLGLLLVAYTPFISMGLPQAAGLIGWPSAQTRTAPAAGAGNRFALFCRAAGRESGAAYEMSFRLHKFFKNPLDFPAPLCYNNIR